MPLDQPTFTRLNDLLVPLMDDETIRRAWIGTALYGCSVLPQIDWSDAAMPFTARLIRTLDVFGECNSGRPALIALLEGARKELGVNHHPEIDDLINRLQPQPVSPAGIAAPYVTQTPFPVDTVQPWLVNNAPDARPKTPTGEPPKISQTQAANGRDRTMRVFMVALGVGVGLLMLGLCAMAFAPVLFSSPSNVTPSVEPISSLEIPSSTPSPTIKLLLARSIANCPSGTAQTQLSFRDENFDLTSDVSVMKLTPRDIPDETAALESLTRDEADVVIWGTCEDALQVDMTFMTRPYDELLFEPPLRWIGSVSDAVMLARAMIFYSYVDRAARAVDEPFKTVVASLETLAEDSPTITLFLGNMYARAEEWAEALDRYESVLEHTDEQPLRVLADANAGLAGRFRSDSLKDNCLNFDVVDHYEAALKAAREAELDTLVPLIEVGLAYAQFDCPSADGSLETVKATLKEPLEANIAQAYVLQAYLEINGFGDYEAGFEAACKALQLDPTEFEAYVSLGMYYILIEGDQARAETLNALEMAKKSPWFDDSHEAQDIINGIDRNESYLPTKRPVTSLPVCSTSASLNQ